MSVPFMWVDGNLTLMIKNKAYQVLPDHVNYKMILDNLPSATEDELVDLVDIQKCVSVYSNGTVEVKDGKVLYLGEEVNGGISKRILEFISKKATVLCDGQMFVFQEIIEFFLTLITRIQHHVL